MKLQINEHTTIKKFKFIDDQIHEFMKHGNLQPYRKFKGKIKKQKVKGFVCLNDDQIYKLEKA